MEIKTKYKIGDAVYVFNENKLQKTEIKGIYVSVYTIYPTTEPQLKTVINYDLTLIEGSIEEDLVYHSVEDAKENVVIEG
jgi:hypothetical protein|tara:strand:+ start:3597 stop:3836 length:240 start_codon:yes stop_codon:yes gene_type:complete